MLIKVLYVVLVLCTVALVGAGAALYLKIRRHMRGAGKPAPEVPPDQGHTDSDTDIRTAK